MKLNYADLINKPEKFTFFWETKSPFSQWHTCKFSACGQDFIKTGVQSKFLQAFPFTSAEQYMMFHKALAFHDFETCEEILKTSNVRQQKLLGRSVKGYNETIWQEIRIPVVYTGNKEKFTQNKNLQDASKRLPFTYWNIYRNVPCPKNQEARQHHAKQQTIQNFETTLLIISSLLLREYSDRCLQPCLSVTRLPCLSTCFLQA